MKIHVCKDGSHTLYSETYKQFYHNPNGAISESKHVYLDAGGIQSAFSNHEPVSILEIGFGTGLNLILLLDLWKRTGSNSRIHFQSIESNPLSADLAGKLNYGSILGNPSYTELLTDIFKNLRPGYNRTELSSHMLIDIFSGKFESFAPVEPGFTHIFHDPFSPQANPELWSADVFKRMAFWSDPDVKLMTYCAATQARASMAVAGWQVAGAPGALGKWEMTIAALNPVLLSSYEVINQQKLQAKYSDLI